LTGGYSHNNLALGQGDELYGGGRCLCTRWDLGFGLGPGNLNDERDVDVVPFVKSDHDLAIDGKVCDRELL